MKSCQRRDFAMLTLCLLAALGAAGPASGLNDVDLTAAGTGAFIEVTVAMDLADGIPADWVGWIVERTTIGACDAPVVRLDDVRPFPTGATAITLVDTDVVAPLTYYYRVYAIDDQGVRRYLTMDLGFAPGYYHLDFASPEGAGIISMGTLTDLGWTVGIEECADACWGSIQFIGAVLPPGLEALVGTDRTVILYGTLDAEFEGTYVTSITAWNETGPCGPVATEKTDWGSLKAVFR